MMAKGRDAMTPMPVEHEYDTGFFDYIERGARRSAARIVPLLRSALQPASVLDVGCGRGVWLAEWQRNGVGDALGIDGAYVDRTRLAVAPEHFRATDIAAGFSLGRRFDLVQSLEVAEHITAGCADDLVDSICRHGDVVVFSAAVPGQGGEMHVNEQPLEYWRRKFAQRGFAAYDWLRPQIVGEHAIEPWYRFNTLIYVRNDATARLPASFAAARVAQGQPIAERAPLFWRLRNAGLRHLPVPVVNRLAMLKHAAALMIARR